MEQCLIRSPLQSPLTQSSGHCKKKATALYNASNVTCPQSRPLRCDPVACQRPIDPSSLFAGMKPVLQLQLQRMVGFVRHSCQTVDGYVSYSRTATQLLFILTVVSVFLFMLHYFVFLFFSYRRDFSPTMQFRCAICECCVSFSRQNINCVCAKEAEMLNTRQARPLLFAKHHLHLKDVDCLITVEARVNCSMSSDSNMT